MERLTKHSYKTSHKSGIACAHFFSPECHSVEGNCSRGCPWEEEVWLKLAHYEDFEEAGRLLVLPCKVGDRVFCILHSKNEIVEDVVEDYDIWSIKNGLKLRISLLNINDYVVGEFGKTVFLTLEEAEAALKGEA